MRSRLRAEREARDATAPRAEQRLRVRRPQRRAALLCSGRELAADIPNTIAAPSPGPRFLSLQNVELVEVAAQPAAHLRGAQLAKRLRLDLPDALARDAELLPDLFERAIAAILQPEAQDDDALLTLVELAQRLADLIAQQLLGGEIHRRRDRVVFDKVAQEGVSLHADRGFERHRVACGVEHLAHFFFRHIHGAGDLQIAGLALEDLLETVAGLLNTIDRLADVHR